MVGRLYRVMAVVFASMLIMLLVLQIMAANRMQPVQFFVRNRLQAEGYLLDAGTGVIQLADTQRNDGLLSPDGDLYLLSDVDANDVSLTIIDADGTERFLGHYSYRTSRGSVRWSADGQIVIVETLGNQVNIYKVDAISGAVATLEKIEFPVWQIVFSDSHQLLLLSLNNANQQAVAVNLVTGESRDIGTTNGYSISPDNRRIAYFDLSDSSRLMIADLQTGDTLVYDRDSLGDLRLMIGTRPLSMQWMSDTALAINLSERATNRDYIYQLDVVNRSVTKRVEGDYLPIQFSASQEYGILYQFDADTGNFQIGADTQRMGMFYLWRLSDNRITPLFEAAPTVIPDFAWSPDGDYLVVDYLPDGLKHNRHIEIFAIRDGAMIHGAYLPVIEYIPVNDPLDMPIRWQPQ